MVVAITEGLLVVRLEEDGGDMVAEASLNHKVRWILIVWMLLLLTFSKIR